MPASDPAPTAEPNPTFEGAMERLETLVEQMENARLPLEELIRSYEEGIRLVRVCNERLTAAEQRIEIITRDAAGQAQTSEFPAAGASAKPSSTREAKPAPDSQPAAAPAARPTKKPNEVSLF